MPRYGTNKAIEDSSIVDRHYSDVAFGATISLTPDAFESTYKVGQLTGGTTINLDVTHCEIDDRIKFLFSADASIRVVTPGTGFGANVGTSSITASRNGVVSYVFDGAAFIKVSEELEA